MKGLVQVRSEPSHTYRRTNCDSLTTGHSEMKLRATIHNHWAVESRHWIVLERLLCQPESNGRFAFRSTLKPHASHSFRHARKTMEVLDWDKSAEKPMGEGINPRRKDEIILKNTALKSVSRLYSGCSTVLFIPAYEIGRSPAENQTCQLSVKRYSPPSCVSH